MAITRSDVLAILEDPVLSVMNVSVDKLTVFTKGYLKVAASFGLTISR